MKLPFLQYLLQLISRREEKESLRKRELITDIGLNFCEWAGVFLSENNVNRLITLEKALTHYNDQPYTFKEITVMRFKNKLKMYCELKGFEFNPIEVCTDGEKRIIMFNNQTDRSMEYLFIKTAK